MQKPMTPTFPVQSTLLRSQILAVAMSVKARPVPDMMDRMVATRQRLAPPSL